MPAIHELMKEEFPFGDTTVIILEGDLMEVTKSLGVDAVVSTDDNYLCMASGLSALLRKKADSELYVREAQSDCPVKAGTVVVTKSYALQELLGVKYVLHGTVIDYDSDDAHLEEIVERTTANCLDKAEELGLCGILLPAFATGSGQLDMQTCALHMCQAIKAFVGIERGLKKIFIILYAPNDPEKIEESQKKNQPFFRQAKLVLDVPYNPQDVVRQVRDFYGRENEQIQLEKIITNETGEHKNNHHVVLLGGPGSGKDILLEQLYHRSIQEGSPLSQGRRLVRLTFGQVHNNTPLSFVYRKFLSALEDEERHINPENVQLIDKIQCAYADPQINCARFMQFLDEHAEDYPQIVFLVERLPRLLQMEGVDSKNPNDIRFFWKDLEEMQERVRFVYTAREEEYQELQRKRLQLFARSFWDRVEVIRLTCVTVDERREWINRIFQRYLKMETGAPDPVHKFFEVEAGQHPYLVSLVAWALIVAIKQDLLKDPELHPQEYTQDTLEPFFRQVRQMIAEPRRVFFEKLLEITNSEQQVDLQNLSTAVAMEDEIQLLFKDVTAQDPNAKKRLEQLLSGTNPRNYLHLETLHQLESGGYVIEAGTREGVQFCAKPLAAFIQEYFRRRRRRDDDPKDLVISLLFHAHGALPVPDSAEETASHEIEAASEEHEDTVPTIWTQFRSRGASVVSAQKPMYPEIRREFLQGFHQLIQHRLHPVAKSDPGSFRDLEQVGNYILTQFTTVEIKRAFQELPLGSSVLMMVDERIKEIPWELMMETAYAGEIPFKAGRVIVSPHQPQVINPMHWDGKITSLLIADPKDDLNLARREVEWLELALRRDSDHFHPPVMLVGSEQCQRTRLLNQLSSGGYGLIHYSGHSQYNGEKSSWLLKDSEISTDMLTNALQMAPPALVFSASCESAEGSEGGVVRYENQSFDLPGAFLQAGVAGYIGTLWKVSEQSSEKFLKEFYSAFLLGDFDLGECLRRAKWACKQGSQWNERINYLAYILYGDPHVMPGHLFPVMSK